MLAQAEDCDFTLVSMFVLKITKALLVFTDVQLFTDNNCRAENPCESLITKPKAARDREKDHDGTGLALFPGIGLVSHFTTVSNLPGCSLLVRQSPVLLLVGRAAHSGP